MSAANAVSKMINIRYPLVMVEALERTRASEVTISEYTRQIIHEYLIVTDPEYAEAYKNSFQVNAQIAAERAANAASQRATWKMRQEEYQPSPMLCYKTEK